MEIFLKSEHFLSTQVLFEELPPKIDRVLKSLIKTERRNKISGRENYLGIKIVFCLIFKFSLILFRLQRRRVGC